MTIFSKKYCIWLKLVFKFNPMARITWGTMLRTRVFSHWWRTWALATLQSISKTFHSVKVSFNTLCWMPVYGADTRASLSRRAQTKEIYTLYIYYIGLKVIFTAKACLWLQPRHVWPSFLTILHTPQRKRAENIRNHYNEKKTRNLLYKI